MLNNPAVKINNLSYHFTLEDKKRFEVLKTISCEVRQGEFFSIVGPSGSGKSTLLQLSNRLRIAQIRCADFEQIIDSCGRADFIFVDPPYRPGSREMIHDHYRFGKFSFQEHMRLAAALKRASKRGVRWALTTSSHSAIVELFRGHFIELIPRGAGTQIGHFTRKSGEVFIRNWRGAR